MVTKALSWLTNLGLQRRIQLLTVASLVAIFALFWVTGQRALEESRQQSLDNQLAMASLVAASLDQHLNGATALLQDTATQPILSDASQPPESGAAMLLRDAQLQLGSYGERLYWLDAQGNVLWTEPREDSPPSGSYPDFSEIRPALESGTPHVSNLLQSSNPDQPYVLLAAPIPSPSGEIEAILVEEIATSRLGPGDVLEAATAEGNAHIEVVDHEGAILASSLAEPSQQLSHAEQFTSLIDNQEPMVGTCHQCHSADGVEVGRSEEVLAFAPLSAAPWGVAVRQPADEVMAPVGYLRRQILLGGAIAVIVALLITWWLITRQILEPIRALDEASAQFAAGNLDVALPDGGIDEVARLTANLEQMRVRLDATLEDHRRWNEALGEMVEERTRELASLYEQLEGREAMCKSLLGKVLTGQEEERTRLARELHDTIGQSLTDIIMTTTAVENSLPADYVSGKDKLAGVRSMAVQTLRDLRGLIFDLRPEVLDDLGLGLALHSQVKKYLEPAGVKVNLRAVGLKDQLPAEVETAVFRMVQEAITNIARHARASEASISLTKKDDRLIVRVEDDGVGFDPDQVLQKQQHAWGLRGMEERVTLLGGKFYIGSRPGNGTLVLAEVPLDGGLEDWKRSES
jgi:signal transduction histidine kinase